MTAPEEAEKEQPDIDDLLAEFKREIEECWGMHEYGSYMNPEGVSSEEHFKQALYQRLAAEAVERWDSTEGRPTKVVPLETLKAIMEIQE